MNCRRADRLILDHAGGDLSPERAAALEAHLENCPACRARLQDTRSALAALKVAGKEVTPPDYEATLAAIQRPAGKIVDLAGLRDEPRRSTARVLSFAAGFFLTVAVIGLLRLGPDSRGQPLVDRGSPAPVAPAAAPDWRFPPEMEAGEQREIQELYRQLVRVHEAVAAASRAGPAADPDLAALARRLSPERFIPVSGTNEAGAPLLVVTPEGAGRLRREWPLLQELIIQADPAFRHLVAPTAAPDPTAP